MIQLNALNCLKVLFGTGLIPCLLKLKDFKSFIIVPNSWSLNVEEDTFNMEYVLSKIQDGTFVPFLNTVEFTDNTPEPTTKEYQGGITAVIRNGKPTYSFEYDNGIMWHQAAYSYNSFSAYSVIIIDSAGTIAVQASPDGTKISGFRLSMLNTRTYVTQVGDETAKTLIEFQIANEEAFNKRMALISVDDSGLDINTEVQGIIGVNINGTASVANDINVSVNASLNSIFGIEALTAANFRVRNVTSGTVLTITTVTQGTNPGDYKIEVSEDLVLGNKIVVETYDSTATPPVATAKVGDNQFYRGVSPELTVVA